MQMMNHTDTADQLIAVETELCDEAQIHMMTMNDEGVMHMEEVANGRLNIPAHETITLEPGGLHLMCLGKDQALEEGDEIGLTLIFEKYGEMMVTAVIQDEAITEGIEHNH